MSEGEFNRLVGLRIRASRRSLDITQTQLGAYLGCVTSFICDMEKGRKAINAHTLYLLEQKLGPLWPAKTKQGERG